MTAITILNGDFEILFEDETVGGNAVAGMKMVRRASGASATKYTTNALYSAVADAADDFQAMGFENPMLPVTLNAYTMENDYFIPRSSTEWLEEGAIEADWDLNIRSITYAATIADFATTDIGRQVVGGTTGDTGTLLDFEVLPDGTLLAWIRPDDPTPVTGDLFDNPAETLTCTGDGGTGNCTSTAVSSTGTSLYSSIQAIGAVPTATEVYLIQERQKMTDSTAGFQWWDTDPNVSLGIIDILIRVKRDSIEIADGDVEIFARRYTSLYDNFRLNVAAGGRSALPLASAADINNTTGYRAFTGGTGVNTFDVGNGIYVGATWATATVKAVLTAVGGTVADPELEYYLVGDLTDFANTDAVKEYIFATAVDGDATCIATAPAANLLGPTDPAAGEGGTVTITAGNNNVDHDGDAVAEAYSVTIDAQGDVTAAKVYERIKYVTRRGADEADLFGAGINIPGETYRGLELQAQYITPVGTFTEGDDVTSTSVPGYTSRVISVNTTDTYVMLTDQQTSIWSIGDTNLIQDEGGDSVTIDGAPDKVTSPKASPFGAFTGSQIFGAPGVVYINPHTDDTQSYILTDDNGFQRTPPNTVAFVVSNTLALDRVLVARDTGTAGIIDKDQFGGIATAVVNSSLITVTGTIDSEVADAGFVRVVETTLQEEHHYEYSARVSGASGTFTLSPVTEGTGITTLGTATLGIANLVDTTANFTTNGARVGMLVKNTTATKLHHIWEIVEIAPGSPAATDTIVVRQLYGPFDATQDWDITDTYSINTIIGDHAAVPVDYAVTDDLFDLIIDQEATTTTTSNTFVKILTSPFNVVVNVRQGKIILPFTQNPSVGDAGGSVSVVRAADTIAA